MNKGQTYKEPKLEEFPVTGLINKSGRLNIIYGDAGSGKSTAIKRIAYLAAEKGLQDDEKYRIPILLRATDIANSLDESLLDICVRESEKLLGAARSVFSDSDLIAGRVIVFIDALDEAANNDYQKAIIQKANTFHQDYPNVQIIITSRDYPSIRNIPELKHFDSYRITPINYKEAEQILKRLEKRQSLSTETSKEILRRIQEIHGMELNPLLVTIFASTADDSRKDVPANITELFKKYTELMLGRWDLKKKVSQQYHAPLKDFILTKIAYEMHIRREVSIDVAELKKIIILELENRGLSANADNLMDEIISRSGLLRVFGEKAEFRHMLLQEFFAGRGIPSNSLLEGYISDLWWQRAIVFYFGQNPGDGSGLNLLMNSLKNHQVADLFIASITLGMATQACYLVEIKEKIESLKWVVEGLSQSKDFVIEHTENKSKFPLSTFISYYLYGRESVACSIPIESWKNIEETIKNSTLDSEEKELRQFWVIVGMVEAGMLEDAEQMIKKFHPTDLRLLLALHMGGFLIGQLRVSSKEDKKIAERICKHVEGAIIHLRKQIVDEFRTELFEIRKDNVVAVESPKMIEG